MADGEQIDMARSQVFGEAADLYDRGRPGYADALVTEVLEYAALDGRPALEIGAGTGKATALLAARGTELECVEPDPRMAAVLRRNTAAHPGVRVRVCTFEEWDPEGRRFGLVLAATCWHWLDPDRRRDGVHAALVPGGAVALCWNPQGVRDPRLHAALAEVDRRHGLDDTPHGVLASHYGELPGDWVGLPGWPEDELRRDGRFTDLRTRRFREELHYGTDRYLAHLASLSRYRILPADRREQALSDTARVLDAHGGGITMDHLSDLLLARAR
ncbi:methyltransferase family protein [Streptomyces sp. TLI_235]|nr:class I SAM-dependent methyltransferase [Streptomyces sp. TLI_235]PBC67424.1 methyltransferase family protein [Streptomyces sp. TLI_235]